MKLTDHAHSFIIHSYGRTGSVLLAANLRNSLTGLRTDPVKYVKNLPYDFSVNQPTIFHTHLTFDQSVTPGLRRVFSIRQNSIEQILSFVMATRFKQHHIQFNATPLVLEPFVFDQWHQIDELCEYSLVWHQYYAQQLRPEDLVVSYEIFTSANQITEGWGRIYPDKFKTVLNHFEVADYIIKKTSWRNELNQFLSHTNPFDIYCYTTGATV